MRYHSHNGDYYEVLLSEAKMTNKSKNKVMKGEFLLINLDRSTDRLARSRALLQQHNIEFNRISAVDGRELPANQLSALLAPDYSAYYKVLTASEVGCYLSHKKCWQYILDHQLDYAVILEDDFSVNADVSKLNDYLSAIEVPWDYIKLMEYPIKRKAIQTIACLDRNLVRYDKVPIRACAYAITKQCAEKMLASHQKIARPVDVDCQYWWESGISVFGMKPYIFSVNLDTESTIDGGGNRKVSKKSIVKQYLHKLQFAYKNYKHTKKQQS